jgi:pantetheine-phosphate adenylyltransferase
MNVCIGGTFDKLHKGHKTLIKKAFETAGEKGSVFIGVTTDDFAKNKKIKETLNQRINNIKEYLNQKKYHIKYDIKPIFDRYGPSINNDFDAIVVSTDTVKTAEEINNKRQKIGKKPLKIIQIPLIKAQDGARISSTRIRNKEINKNGKIVKKCT